MWDTCPPRDSYDDTRSARALAANDISRTWETVCSRSAHMMCVVPDKKRVLEMKTLRSHRLSPASLFFLYKSLGTKQPTARIALYCFWIPGLSPQRWGFCSDIRTVISAEFMYRSEAAPRRSLKWRVTYRIGVHTIKRFHMTSRRPYWCFKTIKVNTCFHISNRPWIRCDAYTK